MHTRLGIFAVLGVLVVAVVAGCKPQGAAPTPDASTVSAPPPLPPTAGDPKLAHCPSAVAGTNTSIKDADGGIQLTVTARDDTDTAAINEIRTRAAFYVDAAKKVADAVHNGSGDVGGMFGRCPIVMRDTALTSTDVPAGSSVTIVARDPKETDWLRRESRSRVDELAAPATDPSAHAKETHCPTTVAGAKLAVNDVPGSVAVTITAADAAAAKEIRDRSHALVAASKLGPSARGGGGGGGGGGAGGGGGGHGHGDGTGPGPGDGTGMGVASDAGALAKCPLLMRGTTIDAKDQADGIVFTITPSSLEALPQVRKEIRDRIANGRP